MSIHDKLFEYQKLDRDAMIARRTAILAESIGSGKTVIAMSVMDRLWEQALVDKVLVVAPNSAIPQWCEMIKEWLGVEAFPVLGGQGKEHRYHAYNWFKDSTRNPILVLNYHSLRTDINQLVYLGIKAVFMDEATAIKGLDSAAAIAAQRFSMSCDYRFPMTGTPVQNNLLELHAIMSAVNPNILGNYFYFRSRYCVDREMQIPCVMKNGRRGTRPVKKIVGYQRLEELKPAIELYCIRHGAGEIAEKLPEVVVENRFVELSPAQKVKYNELVEGFFATESGVKYMNALEKVVRLFECCDSLKMLGDVEDRSNKIDEVMNLLTGELQGTGTIVFSQFKIPLRSIAKRLYEADIPFGVIDGDVPVMQRGEVQDKFNSGAIKVLLITTAGEMALNLQGGSCLIMLDRLWNPARNQQILGRINRVGQSKKSVVLINIIARGTVDENVFKVLKAKTTLINELFEEKNINCMGIEELKCLVRGDLGGIAL